MHFEAGGSAPPESLKGSAGEISPDPVYLLFRDRDICEKEDGNPLLSPGEIETLIKSAGRQDAEPPLYLGLLSGAPCYALSQDSEELPPGLAWTPLRPRFVLYRAALARAAARGRHLLTWKGTVQFCSRCGTPVEFHPEDMALSCGSCGQVHYPKISPAVITAVIRDDRILLAHNRNFPGNMYSLIAGFVDPGETLEETVVREIREEVGLSVTDVRYRTSQPWPFPDSLMCAFTACWAGGEILPDGKEITDARWFSRENLPEIPAPGSVSRELIDMFLSGTISTCQKSGTEG